MRRNDCEYGLLEGATASVMQLKRHHSDIPIQDRWIDMYNYHAWAVLRPSPADYEESEKNSVIASIGATVTRLQAFHREIGMRPFNGEYMLWAFGCRNHRGQEAAEIHGLFAQIAREAPGSFGLFYEFDDESADFNIGYVVWRLARGSLELRLDPFLSPVIPTVEDEG